MAKTPADKILKEIEGIAKAKFLPIVGPKKGKVLARLVRELKPKRVLEVGTLIGYSAILMAKYMKPNASLITIEIHPDEVAFAESNIRRAEVPPKVKVIQGDARQVIPTLKGPFDLMFIDAEKNEYLAYLKMAEGELHKGSVVAADNAGIFADQMKDYLKYVRRSGRYNSRFVPVGEDGLEISVKKK